MRLTEIPHDTDKTSYLPHYEGYFQRIADEPIVLLELGIDKGGSLLLWRDYFSRASIVGLDENKVTLDDESGRIKTYQGRQEDLALLERVGAECAPEGFDIIIDDCAHIGALARTSFWFLFERYLKPGGIYAIEDWGTAYWPKWPDGKAFEPGGHTHGMAGFVKELVDEVATRAITDPEHGAPPHRFPRIVRLDFHPGLVIAQKGLKHASFPE